MAAFLYAGRFYGYGTTNEFIDPTLNKAGAVSCAIRQNTAPAFLFSEQKKQVEEVLRVDPKNLNSYVGVVNQPPPKWSSVKKWLLHINYAPGYAPEPEQKPVCRQFSRCEGCPYPAHGFLCWGGEDDCMRTRVKKLNEKELEHEDQSGFV